MAKTLTATMRAVAVTPKKPGSARQVELPIPAVSSEMALMRVLEVGIDGTDTEINNGLYGEAPPGSDFLVIGHEALSVVEAVGEGVVGFEAGDLVISTVRRPDNCPNCQAGESDMCLFGNYTERGIKGAHGYMGDYYGETPAFMVKIPLALRPFAVLLEPLSIVEKATYQTWKIQDRMLWAPKRAVVLGAGPIGILATILLRLRGLEVHVYAKSSPDTLQGRILNDLGATYRSVADHPVMGIKSELGQIDFILEGTGNSAVAFQAMAQLGTNGVLCLTGVSAGNRSVEIPADVINLEMVLGNRVTFGSVNANRRYFEMGVQHFQQAEQRWPGIFERLITRRVPFADFTAALARRPEDIKTLLTIADA
jgi:threonine dehydrogenase-like Zn-dependent dehydrogenase